MTGLRRRDAPPTRKSAPQPTEWLSYVGESLRRLAISPTANGVAELRTLERVGGGLTETREVVTLPQTRIRAELTQMRSIARTNPLQPRRSSIT